MTEQYPRVLILSRTEITEFNSQGAALGNWFRDWPKERLAHMYSAPRSAREPYCSYRYLLTGRERRLGSLFDWIKQVALDQNAGERAVQVNGQTSNVIGRLVEGFRIWRKSALLKSGFGEVVFVPKMSLPLRDWLNRFQPEVVFAMVTDLGYMRYALMLSDLFQLPLCVEIADDWPTTLYQDSSFKFAMVPLLDRTLKRLLERASICLTIGKEMEKEYKRRYQISVEALMCCEEPERFFSASPKRATPQDEITIVYCGGLCADRCQSMLELLACVDALRSQGMNIGVSIYSSEIEAMARDAFLAFPWARFFDTPAHEEVPGILKGADILFHGEGFDSLYQDYIRYSVSSKIQIYMLSGIPILIYAPAGVGIVEYARSGGWACIVDRQDPNTLQNAVVRLATDTSFREQLVMKGYESYEKNHNSHRVRERLRQILCQVAEKRPIKNSESGKAQCHV